MSVLYLDPADLSLNLTYHNCNKKNIYLLYSRKMLELPSPLLSHEASSLTSYTLGVVHLFCSLFYGLNQNENVSCSTCLISSKVLYFSNCI